MPPTMLTFFLPVQPFQRAQNKEGKTLKDLHLEIKILKSEQEVTLDTLASSPYRLDFQAPWPKPISRLLNQQTFKSKIWKTRLPCAY
jgi:hypothetical protein